MDFLNKLYENDYFGIGLFAVISFLVVTFLVVLFFGKKDEKKRKLEATNQALKINETENTFKETSVETPVEMPVAPDPIELAPVMPINVEPVAAPIAPINFESEPIQPVAPVNYENVKIEEPVQFVDNLTLEESKNIEPIEIISEPITPIIEPVNVETIKLEPIKYEMPVEPQVLEPVKINIPNEPINIEPIIKEEEKTIFTPISEPTPIIEEPAIKETYYQPIETENIREVEEIKVPNIDFDALAESISKELDELEKNTNKREYEEVRVTPIEELTRPTNQFSSVYVNKPAAPIMKETIDLPKKIDLPTMKSGEIEPENYTL